MAKKVLTLIKLQIPAGAANPAPPVGPALGQHGVNIMEFCKAFNAQTQQDAGTIIPVEITVYEDRSFTFITKTPPAAVLIKRGDRDREGLGRAAREQGRDDHRRPGAPDRRAQDARPERQRPRRRRRRSSPAPPARWASTSRGWKLMARGKRYRAAYEKVDRDRAVRARPRPCTLVQETAVGQVRRDRRAPHAARASTSATPRSSCAAPWRSRTGWARTSPIAVFAEGDEARAAPGGRRRVRRRRGPRRAVEEGWTDFDVAIATPGADGPGRRQARPRARPAGQDAEPEGRHRHRRHRQGRRRGQVRQGRVPHRPQRHHPPDDRQGELRRATRCWRTTPR